MNVPAQLVFQSAVHEEQAPPIWKGVIENAVQAIEGVVGRFEGPRFKCKARRRGERQARLNPSGVVLKPNLSPLCLGEGANSQASHRYLKLFHMFGFCIQLRPLALCFFVMSLIEMTSLGAKTLSKSCIEPKA